MGRTVHRNVEYPMDAEHDEKIISLTQELNDALAEVKRINAEIEEFQDNCEHEYYMTSTGAYDDCYECIHCGKNEWF